MKIDTLVTDINNYLSNPHPPSEENLSRFAEDITREVSKALSGEEHKTELRMSNLGAKCDRQLYYKVNEPEKAEPLPPEAKMKFLFGHIIEALVLLLVKESGHEVTDEQKEVDIDGVKGHMDCRIDGVITDVKSASTYGFRKFKDGLNPGNDDFGYLDQLNSYVYADPVPNHSKGAFLAIDKQLGHICLDVHDFKDKDYGEIILKKREMLEQGRPPQRAYLDTEDGKSGNRKLETACSYCAFKESCWPGLRTFLYASGPRYLTEVKKIPDVPEAG